MMIFRPARTSSHSLSRLFKIGLPGTAFGLSIDHVPYARVPSKSTASQRSSPRGGGGTNGLLVAIGPGLLPLVPLAQGDIDQLTHPEQQGTDSKEPCDNGERAPERRQHPPPGPRGNGPKPRQLHCHEDQAQNSQDRERRSGTWPSVRFRSHHTSSHSTRPA